MSSDLSTLTTLAHWGSDMNQVKTLALTALAGALVISLAGCGGGAQYVAVSGVVKLDGKPHRNAMVMFQPMASTENPNPGRGSSGRTDDNGRFTLKTFEGQRGAVIGKHRVRIMSMVKAAADPIPAEWNQASNKEFDVPTGGTDQANFDIVTKK